MDPNKCEGCGVDIRTLEECNAVFYIAAYQITGPGYFDPELPPDWGNRLLQKPRGRFQMCYHCAGAKLTFTGNLDEIHAPEQLPR